ncbi:hypothetical protein [Daejeonella sp.]|uniref:hypothetical protein n=1 Tax=Daejeonella sp. TaxID=2805397 RepID=UPI0030C38062
MKTLKLILTLSLLSSAFFVYAQDTAEKSEKKQKIKVEKPFTIHDKSFRVVRVDVRKDLKGAQNVIQIDATNAAGGTGTLTQATLPPAVITNVNIVNGSYNQTRELGKTPRGMSLQLLDVVFPCRVRLTISDQFVDVEIKEAGFWKVAVGLAK